MPLLEDFTASFIVRIWRELGNNEGRVEEWRGSIEHVQSGTKGFFRDLRTLLAFMHPHLRSIGIGNPVRFWETLSGDLEDVGAKAVEEPGSMHGKSRSRIKH